MMNTLDKGETKQRLKELYGYVCAQPISQKIVAEHFSSTERQSLTNENGAVMPDFVARIAEHRGVPMERLVIELAFEAKLLDAGEYKKLRRGIDQPIDGDVFGDGSLHDHKKTVEPHWDKATGKLLLEDEVIGTFRIRSPRTKPQTILDAFQADGWANCIRQPFGKLEQCELHGAVNYLNGRVSKIRFHAQGGAKELTWEMKPK